MKKNDELIDEQTVDETAAQETPATNEANENETLSEADTKDLNELNERYLRIAAEYDNFRKRTQKEKEEIYSAALSSTVIMFLPLLDNLDRAAAYEPENEGTEMIKKQLLEIFEKLGVKEIESDNMPFDPELHNAIMHEEDPDKEQNVVAETFQKGYILGDRVLRHSMVKVVN